MSAATATNFDEKLENAYRLNNSRLCVGLDPDLSMISPDKVIELNKVLVDATSDLACAYKPNLAIYESLGREGYEVLEATLRCIRDINPSIPIIGDAKRGDIGLCGDAYSKTMLDYGFDAVTVNPYIGLDALKPFLDIEDLGVFILCKTSNPSGAELQDLRLASGKLMYEHVAELAETRWNWNGNVGLVVGATYPSEIRRVRKICPQMPFLIPGVGAQGGDIEQTVSSAINDTGGGFVINASRQIMYAAKDANGKLSLGQTASQKVRQVALHIRDEINRQISVTTEKVDFEIPATV